MYSQAEFSVCILHAGNMPVPYMVQAWNIPKCMYVSDLYHACPVPVKRPNSLHVPILSNETCTVYVHYALQDHAISMHEIM